MNLDEVCQVMAEYYSVNVEDLKQGLANILYAAYQNERVIRDGIEKRSKFWKTKVFIKSIKANYRTLWGEIEMPPELKEEDGWYYISGSRKKY